VKAAEGLFEQYASPNSHVLDDLSGGGLTSVQEEVELFSHVNKVLAAGWKIESSISDDITHGGIGQLRFNEHSYKSDDIATVIDSAISACASFEELLKKRYPMGNTPPQILHQVAHVTTLRSSLIPVVTRLETMRAYVRRLVRDPGDLDARDGALGAAKSIIPPPPCPPWLPTYSEIASEARLVIMHCEFLVIRKHLEKICSLEGGGTDGSMEEIALDGARAFLERTTEKDGLLETRTPWDILEREKFTHLFLSATLIRRVRSATNVEYIWCLGSDLCLPCDSSDRRHELSIPQLLTASISPIIPTPLTPYVEGVLMQARLYALDTQLSAIFISSLYAWAVSFLEGQSLASGSGKSWVEEIEAETRALGLVSHPPTLSQLIALASFSSDFSSSPLLSKGGTWKSGGLLQTATLLNTPALVNSSKAGLALVDLTNFASSLGDNLGGFLSGEKKCSMFEGQGFFVPRLLLRIIMDALSLIRLHTSLDALITLAIETTMLPVSGQDESSWHGLDSTSLRSGIARLSSALEDFNGPMMQQLCEPPFSPVISSSQLKSTKGSLINHTDSSFILEMLNACLDVRIAIVEAGVCGCSNFLGDPSLTPNFSPPPTPSLSTLTRTLTRLESVCSKQLELSGGTSCLTEKGMKLLQRLRTTTSRECYLASCCLRCATLERGPLLDAVLEGSEVSAKGESFVFSEASLSRLKDSHTSAISLGGPLTPWAERLLFTSNALIRLRSTATEFISASIQQHVDFASPAQRLARLPLRDLLNCLSEGRKSLNGGFMLPVCITELERAQALLEDFVFGKIIIPLLQGADGDLEEVVVFLGESFEVVYADLATSFTISSAAALSAAICAVRLREALSQRSIDVLLKALDDVSTLQHKFELESSINTSFIQLRLNFLSFDISRVSNQVEIFAISSALDDSLCGRGPLSDRLSTVGISWKVGGEVGSLELVGAVEDNEGRNLLIPFDPLYLSQNPLALEASVLEAMATLQRPAFNSLEELSGILSIGQVILKLRKSALAHLNAVSSVDELDRMRDCAETSLNFLKSAANGSPHALALQEEAQLCLSHHRFLSCVHILQCALQEECTGEFRARALSLPIPSNSALTLLSPILSLQEACNINLPPVPSCPTALILPDVSGLTVVDSPPSKLIPAIDNARACLALVPADSNPWHSLYNLITLGSLLLESRKALVLGQYEECTHLASSALTVLPITDRLKSSSCLGELSLMKEVASGILERTQTAKTLVSALRSPILDPDALLNTLYHSLSLGLPFDPVLCASGLFKQGVEHLSVTLGGLSASGPAWITDSTQGKAGVIRAGRSDLFIPQSK